MERGVIEWLGYRGQWWTDRWTLDYCLFLSLRWKGSFPWTPYRYRYRVGRRAVMLWPESEMGKVVEL